MRTARGVSAALPLMLVVAAARAEEVITAEELARLPVRGYADAVALQSGVVDFAKDLELQLSSTEESRNGSTLIVRGGRPGHTGYFVDGELEQDPLTGMPAAAVVPAAISEVVLRKSGFEAAHGRFQSGMVDVITREGGSRLSGSLEAVTDNLAGEWINTGATDYNVYAASLGGPLLRPEHTFFAAGERRWLGDRRPSAGTRELAEMARRVLGAGEITAFEQAALDGLAENRLPSNSLDGWSWFGKLGFRMGEGSKLDLTHQGAIDRWQQYRPEYLFDHIHAPRYEDRSFSGAARFTRDLGPSTSVRAGFHYAYVERKRGDGEYFTAIRDYSRPNANPDFYEFATLFFDADDPATEVVRSATGQVMGGDEGHVFDEYLRRIASYEGLSASITRRAFGSHEFEIGGDWRRHSLRRYRHFFPVNLLDGNGELTWGGRADVERYGFDLFALDENDDPDFLGTLDGEKHPVELALYAQDKLEADRLTLAIGLRYDYFDSDTRVPFDPFRPLDAGTPGRVDEADLDRAPVHHRVSPRLAVAIAAAPSTTVRFSYGKFVQPPELADVFAGYRFFEHKVNTGGYFSDFANARLEPEETTAYEVGVTHALMDGLEVDVSAYHRRSEDLVLVRNIASMSTSTRSYSGYVNGDFGTVKGLDVDLVLRRVRRLAAKLSYGLSEAEATGSLPGSQRDLAWTARDAVQQTFPLDFDQRHKLALDLDYRLAAGEGPLWGPIRPFADAGVNVLFTAGSGTPYTPTEVFNEVTLANVASEPIGAPNSRRGPRTQQVDLKVDKGFAAGGLRWNAYVWVLNLLDRDNVIDVYASSGSAATTGFLTTENGRAFVEHSRLRGSDADVADFYRLRELDPLHFGVPRLVRFGLKAEF